MYGCHFKVERRQFYQRTVIINGPHYFLLAAKGKDSSTNFSSFFSSFEFTPFKYAPPKQVTDTFMHFTVMTPVVPQLDENFRALLENFSGGNFSDDDASESYWQSTKNALFKSDSTGEIDFCSHGAISKILPNKEQTAFREKEINKYLANDDMVLSSSDSFFINKNIKAYSFYHNRHQYFTFYQTHSYY